MIGRADFPEVGCCSLISFDKVSFSYGEEAAGLREISLSVAQGEFVLVCGPSGCGKTTVTRMLNGLIPHFFDGRISGSLRIFGEEPAKMTTADLSDIVGSVFQNPRTQFFNADTDSELVFGLENQGMPVGQIRERLSFITRELHLENLRGRNIFELSGGEKQKIAFGSSFAPLPKILVLDEPSSNLDHRGIRELSRLLRKAKERGMTILVSEHRIWYLTDILDRVVFMREGRVEKVFSSAEFRNLSEEEYKGLGLRSRTLLPARRAEEKPSAQGLPILSVRDLCVTTGGRRVLDKLCFEVRGGEIVAVTGCNGEGKTTLVRALCGLQKNSGEIRWKDKKLSRRERMRISYMVMQDVGHQLFADSVETECRIGTEEVSEERIDGVLDSVGLGGYKDRHPLSLSGGQKQRLAVAVSLLCRKELLIFDEPTSGLDLIGMQQVADLLETLSRQGKIVLVITHDLELMEKACSRILRLKDGKIDGDWSRRDFELFYKGVNDEG